MIMKYFSYSHLPPHLQDVSKPLGDLAKRMNETLPDCTEKSAGLRKLLEAKDCFVRAALEKLPESIVHYKCLTESGDNPTIKQLSDLWNKCRAFVEEHQVSCPESVHQVDSINLACTDFVAEICECVGFYKESSEEEDEDGEGCETGDRSMP